MQLPLRPNVCLLILNGDRNLFFAERRGCPGVWQFPQGGIDEGLSLEESALKEAHEELGVPTHAFRVCTVLKALNEYEYEVTPPRAAGRWRGQSQSFCVLRYLGRDEDIDLARYDQELMDWRWCTIAEVQELAEPKRLKGYAQALEELARWLAHADASVR